MNKIFFESKVLLDNDMMSGKSRTGQPAERGDGMGEACPDGSLQGVTETDEGEDAGRPAPPGILFGE